MFSQELYELVKKVTEEELFKDKEQFIFNLSKMLILSRKASLENITESSNSSEFIIAVKRINNIWEMCFDKAEREFGVMKEFSSSWKKFIIEKYPTVAEVLNWKL